MLTLPKIFRPVNLKHTFFFIWPKLCLICSFVEFCTPWPEGLETDEDCQKHFPLEVISSDYCFASPNIRDTRARVVTLKVSLVFFLLSIFMLSYTHTFWIAENV